MKIYETWKYVINFQQAFKIVSTLKITKQILTFV